MHVDMYIRMFFVYIYYVLVWQVRLPQSLGTRSQDGIQDVSECPFPIPSHPILSDWNRSTPSISSTSRVP